METHELKEGQVWKYHNREGEDNSTVIISLIKEYQKGDKTIEVIHIGVDNLKIPNAKAPNGYSTYIEHMPFSREALLKSITSLVSENGKPLGNKGYKIWEEAFENNKGGFWTTEVKEAINAISQSLQQ